VERAGFRINLILALVLDPVMNHVGGEDVALEQEVVIALEFIQRHIER